MLHKDNFLQYIQSQTALDTWEFDAKTFFPEFFSASNSKNTTQIMCVTYLTNINKNVLEYPYFYTLNIEPYFHSCYSYGHPYSPTKRIAFKDFLLNSEDSRDRILPPSMISTETKMARLMFLLSSTLEQMRTDIFKTFEMMDIFKTFEMMDVLTGN